MHLIINLVILGAIVAVALSLFQFAVSLFITAIALPVAGVHWLVQKFRS